MNKFFLMSALLAALTASSSDFAFKFYDQVRGGGDNFFFSPASIEAALSMTREGADGETLRQMCLLLPKSFAFPDAGNSITLNSANALWIEQSFPVHGHFKLTLEEKYGAEIRAADFIGQPDVERLAVNRWVEEKTNDRIKDLLASGSVTAMTRLILVNAIYFKSDWLSAFDKALTDDAPFYLLNGGFRNVPMMSMRPAKFNYMQNETFQLLELPYKGNEVSMLAVLPKRSDDLSKVEDGLSVSALNGWIQSMRRTEVAVSFPKFKVETELASLKKTLVEMGLSDAFDPTTADFSNISDVTLFLSDVVHKAFVQVDEEGTEAAAATAVVWRTMAALNPPEQFRADRPFLFFIRHNATGTILFMGRVTNPQN